MVFARQSTYVQNATVAQYSAYGIKTVRKRLSQSLRIAANLTKPSRLNPHSFPQISYLLVSALSWVPSLQGHHSTSQRSLRLILSAACANRLIQHLSGFLGALNTHFNRIQRFLSRVQSRRGGSPTFAHSSGVALSLSHNMASHVQSVTGA
jgi:hypothetical protein